MLKPNASVDASFLINLCAGEIADYIFGYFHLYATRSVTTEIRYPLDALGIDTSSVSQFNFWVANQAITIEDPAQSVDWYQRGENDAIALAQERGYFLLIDDAHPYHRAKSVGLRVVGSAEFAVLLFDHKKLTQEAATTAIKRIRINKQQRRFALTFLESLARSKEETYDH